MDAVISSELRAQLLAEAAALPDEEVCGLLFDEGDGLLTARGTVNDAHDRRASFEIAADALIAAHKAAREGGPRVVGCYHSHPNGRREPSARDTEMARDGDLWLIIAGGDITAWRAGQGGFGPIRLLRRNCSAARKV